MNSNPLVSVCIPSYNHAQYLPYCLESVLAQTYPNIEIIIVDDGSTDNSLEIAREYAAKYSDLIQVHTHPNGANCGISKTSNLGFSLAKGTYWSGLSSDDALYKDKIAKQVEFLEANPEAGFVYSYSDYIDAQGKKVSGRLGEDITQESDPLEALLAYNVIPAVSVLARKEAMVKVGPHDENLIYSDWDFWLRFVALYKVGFIPESLIQFRIHSYNTSIGIPEQVNNNHGLEVFLKLQKANRAEIHKLSEPKYQKNIRRRSAVALLDNFYSAMYSKNYSDAKSAFLKALSSSPRTILHPRRIAAILKHTVISFATAPQPDRFLSEK